MKKMLERYAAIDRMKAKYEHRSREVDLKDRKEVFYQKGQKDCEDGLGKRLF